MERPRPDPEKILAQRYNLANLRVQLRLAENVVTALDEVEREWDRFATGMHAMVKACEEGGLSLWDPGFEVALRKGETIRLDLAGRQQIVLPEFRDPLAKFLRTSLRTYSDALWSLIGLTTMVSGGTMMVPTEEDGEPIYQVSLRTFEINADEAHSEIVRRRRILNEDVSKLKIMLEEAQKAQDEAHKLELENIQAAKLTQLDAEKAQAVKLMPLIWARLKESRVGKIVWWFGEEPLRKLLAAALVAGAVALVRWVVSRL